MHTSPRRRRYRPLLLLLLLLACGRGQARDQADFWQEAAPAPIAVLEPWLTAPVSATVNEDDWAAHIVEIRRFVEGPSDATGATLTVHLRDPSASERRLHLRLSPGTQLPLFRNEAVKVRIFSRQLRGETQRAVIVYARRPLGTGADFKPVLVVSPHDELIPPEVLPRVLTGLTRTEQVAYREARKGEGECTLATTHYLVNAGVDPRAVATPGRKRTLYPPGAHVHRQDRESSYDVTIHDARRTTVAPCPMPDETALVWSAVWLEEEQAKLQLRPIPPPTEPMALPLPPTPTAPDRPPPRKARKPRDAEHPAPKP